MSTLTITRNEIRDMLEISSKYTAAAHRKLGDLRAYFEAEPACFSVDYEIGGGLSYVMWCELVAIKGDATALRFSRERITAYVNG